MAFDRDKLIAELERPTAEDFRAFPYDDATGKQLQKGDTIKGNATTGIGWNLFGRPLSLPRARVICGWFVDDVVQELEAYAWFTGLDDVRARAIAEMAFNLGTAKLMQFSQMVAALRARAWNAAADAALDSKWATQVPMRAKRIAGMIRSGTDSQDVADV